MKKSSPFARSLAEEYRKTQPVKRVIGRWLISTLETILIILHVTIIYVVFQSVDEFVLSRVQNSFHSVVEESAFAAELLKSIKLFSALAIATSYGIHMLYLLYVQGRAMYETDLRGD